MSALGAEIRTMKRSAEYNVPRCFSTATTLRVTIFWIGSSQQTKPVYFLNGSAWDDLATQGTRWPDCHCSILF